jgi:hypothetical protein
VIGCEWHPKKSIEHLKQNEYQKGGGTRFKHYAKSRERK